MANPPKGKAKAKPVAAKRPAARGGKAATSRARAKPVEPGQKYVVFGTVTYADSTPAAGLTVIAYDKDESGKDTLGKPVVTTELGSFSIPYSEGDFRKTNKERGGADVIVCVYRDTNGKRELLFTSKKKNNAPEKYELKITVPAEPFVVRGTVRDAEGKPVKRTIVKAFDRDLRWEEPLGKTHTDQSGFYEITYTAEKFLRSEKVLADLVVRVYGEKNTELVSSAIIFNASAETVVNLSLPGGDPRGLSEFDNLVREITPLLRDVPQNELTEDDIAFLVAETGIDNRYIRWLAESARRHIEANSVDQFVFYALFRQNLPTVLNDLLAQELSTLRDALEKSSQDHVVKHLSSDAMDAIMAKLRALQADHATTPGGGTGGPSSLGDLLRMVLKDAVKIRAVAQLYIAHNSRVSGEFFDELKAIKLFNNQELTDIRLTLQLGEFTDVYLPLVHELLRIAKTDSMYAPIGDLSPYARLTLDAWKEVLHRKQSNGEIIGAPVTVAGENVEEKLANYALSLNQQLERSFPATTIVRRIEADTGDDSPFKESHADLTTFLGNNPGFDLGAQPLDIYLSTNADTKLADVKDREAFTTTLKGIQRVSKLVPNYAAMRTLMANGLHSAQAMVAVGENFFVQKYSVDLGGVEKAQATYRTAKHVQNTAMAMYMKNAPAFRAPLPYVIGGYAASEKGKLLKNKASLPDWTKLFGSLELCECRHCRSLYSPAAYLVDTLNFISDAPMPGDATPLQNLLVRRPDIEHIELTCDNSNTPMPYVDLVNELLEANVASRNFDLPWSAGVVANLDQKTVDDSLISDFKNQHYTLTDKASVRVDSPGLKWTILDASWAFVILNHGQVEGVSAAAWPQTSWSTKELKANPEHTHSDAYDKLREAVYPWRQPFNLPIEEARVYLQHLAVQRHELLAVFLRGATPEPESDFHVACEYLGLSPEEANIIKGSTTGGPANPHSSSGPWDFWGLSETGNSIADPADGSVGNAQGAWSEVLRRVSIFLQRSGLSYREFLDLLDTYYVNPRNVDGPNERTLAIVAADDSNPITCNTAKLALYAVGDDPLEYVAAYDRAHRFVRLARKLGWAMRDLDKAISAFRPVKPSGVPDITDGFLIQLSHVQHLCVEKRVPVVNLLSLWDDIDHTQYVDHLSDGEPAISSLYAQMFISKTLDTTKFPENPAELANQKISLSTAAITAAFGIGADDVNRLHADTLVMPLIPDPANNTVLIRNDNLSLVTLSQLYRHALLARIVGLPIQHYLTALRLVAANPFPSVASPLNTTTTLKFIKAVGRIASSGLSVDDLSYLLCHSSNSTSGLAITESDIGAALDVIRADLRQIANENTFVDSATDGSVATTDPDGELTRQKLALLNWDTTLIEQVVATLNGSATYEAITDTFLTGLDLPNDTGTYEVDLASLPTGFTFPSELAGVVISVPNFLFACDAGIPIESTTAGVISTALNQKFVEKSINLSTPITVTVAIPGITWTIKGRYSVVKNGGILGVYDLDDLNLRASRLLSTPERDLLRNIAVNSNDNGLINATEDLFDLQDQLQGQIVYEPVVVNGQPIGRLRFTGSMTNARKTRLDSVSGVQAYQDAVQALYDAPRNFIDRYMRTFSIQDFATDLAALPDSVKFPNVLKSKIYFDAAAEPKKLHFMGVMTVAEKDILNRLSADQGYLDAIANLFNAPTTPLYQADLLVLPTTVQFPNTLKGKVYYDKATKKLYCMGVMTVAEKDILNRLSADQGYLDAIANLFNALTISPLEVADQFLIASDANLLFDNPATKPAQRFELILSRLLPHLRTTLSERMVKQRLGEHTGLDARTIDGLLNTWVLVPGTIGATRPRAMSTFVDPVFAGSNAVLQISQVAFPQQFATYLLLHKIAAIISKFAFSTDLVRPIFEHGPSRGWLDFNKLPLAPAPDGYALSSGCARLADLAQLRDTLPHGVTAVSDWLAAAFATNAQPSDVIDALSLGTEWNLVDLQSLAGTNGFNLNLDALRSETSVGRLAEAMKLLKRLRATAAQCLAWTRDATGAAAYARDHAQAQDIKNLARAKYDPSQWLQLAGSLRDPLREKQRTALVDYLVATWRFKDANALYAHLLIDVEMSPCMMTTRIKQAISSVQLYVQRTLMNLEEFSELSTTQAKQWSTWRKQYRVWEANRKVLLYPENWIEPELRDDKTPFFKDLESELLQNDLTADIAEDVFINYLEKLDQVARLDIVAMYEDYDGARKVIHVFGRTYAIPHIYFYRRLEGTVWTAWEKVELDIEGDHLIPVVWNRRLHLFWAIFTEKSKPPMADQRASNADPAKYWEIKFYWSEYKSKSWSPKKVSKDFFPHDIDPGLDAPQKPQDYSFKTRISQGTTGQQLSIECYGTTVSRTEAQTTNTSETTTGSATNTQYIVSYYKRQNQAAYWYWLTFTKEYGNPLQPSDIADIKILMKSSETGELYETISLHSSGQYPAPGHFVTITEPVDFFLESTIKQITYVTSKIEFVGGLRVHVGLEAWSPTTTTTTTTTTVPATKQYNPMQGIGEFILDDCNGNLVRVEGPLALTPQHLEPIRGTQMRGMAMEEDLVNSTDVLFGAGPVAVLDQTPGTAFKLLLSPQWYNSATGLSFPCFFQDQHRTYYVLLREAPGGGVMGFKLHFNLFFHPRMCELIKSLNRYGVDGLLTLENQRYTDSGAEFQKYLPRVSLVDLDSDDDALPKEDIDFRPRGTYSQYNWELFFHAPFLIATRLSKNQRFEEAQTWFHYIFDPTSTVSSTQGPERFWKVLPFFDEAARGTQTLEELLADSAKLEKQVLESASKPFNPHAIARLRVVAYMKSVVMHYIDNLLAWGDQLFGRDTIESINEATQLYILAAEMLGKRPERVPPRVTAKVQTYSTLYDSEGPDSLSNALVEVEGYIFPSAAPVAEDGSTPELAQMPYFCTAPNDKLLGYWDLVADRLFKIRHCMNLAGIERSLPIYEPPIDPALLVRAAAAGVDLASALSDVNAPVPHYRFGVMLQKATELCNDVKSLGGALLSALEKRDAEALSLLRSSHEIDVLKAVRQIKEQQAKEASANLEGLNEYQKVITARQQYYLSRTFTNEYEQTQIGLTTASLVATGVQQGTNILASVLHLIPEFKIGAISTIGATYGGNNVAGSLRHVSEAAGAIASFLNTSASLSATLGGFHRRQEDWTHQADLATKELKQVAKQIAAAEIRLAIAEHELENHDLQTENSQEVDAFMRAKFTNRELYNWMVGQLSAVYFQSYQLAYDVAKRAERAYRFELGLRDSSFVQFGYWDSLKKGLLSGERLHFDLKRMDVAYLDQNRREHEITKHISLAALDPMALIKLKETKECFVSLPEALFDMDHPGHYLRRLKSVSVTIPCVTGPYAGVHCTLTLLNSTVRHSSMLLAGRYERQADDIRFTDRMGATQSIVTSSGQNDSGLFEANLRDERYLPFEGAGAISEWRLQLPENFPQFNYETISDVVLHVRYTAREGGGSLADGAQAEVRTRLNTLRQLADGEAGLVQMLSLRHEYPTEWNQLRSGNDGTTRITLNKTRFPFLVSGATVTLIRLGALARVRTPTSGRTSDALDVFSLSLTKIESGQSPRPTANLGFPAQVNLGDLRLNDQGGAIGPVTISDDAENAQWTLTLVGNPPSAGALNVQHRALLEDIVLLVGYRI